MASEHGLYMHRRNGMGESDGSKGIGPHVDSILTKTGLRSLHSFVANQGRSYRLLRWPSRCLWDSKTVPEDSLHRCRFTEEG